MLFLKEFSNGVVSLGDTITLRSSQYKLERYSAYQKTTTKKKKKFRNKTKIFFLPSSFPVKEAVKTGISLQTKPKQVSFQPSRRTGRPHVTEVLNNTHLLCHNGCKRKPPAWCQSNFTEGRFNRKLRGLSSHY